MKKFVKPKSIPYWTRIGARSEDDWHYSLSNLGILFQQGLISRETLLEYLGLEDEKIDQTKKTS